MKEQADHETISHLKTLRLMNSYSRRTDLNLYNFAFIKNYFVCSRNKLANLLSHQYITKNDFVFILMNVKLRTIWRKMGLIVINYF